MPSFAAASLTLLATLLAQQAYAQSYDISTGSSAKCQGILGGDHCCPGSIIGAGGDNAICCVGDPNYNFINPQGSTVINNVAINGNGVNAGNSVKGPSTCTAGTSTAFSALPATGTAPASSNGNGSGTGSSSGSTTTTTNGSQVCVTTKNGGSVSQECHGTGSQGSSGASSGGSSSSNGNVVSSGASSGGSSSSNQQSSSSASHNAGAMATAAPILAGALMGVAALL